LPDPPRRARALLIAGAGRLGRALARLCALRGLSHRLLSRREMDVADPASVAAALEQLRPWAVVNAAGYVRIDDAERDAEACRRENVLGATVLAAACERGSLPLLTFSSDLVFDGRRGTPYRESDEANPLGVYGRCQAEAEAEVARLCPGALIVRSSAFFGPWDESHFVAQSLRALRNREPVAAPDDLTVSPTYVPDLAHACLDLLLDGERGVWHVANRGAATWLELARAAARLAGLDEHLAQGRPASSFGWSAPRRAYSALGSERGLLLPSWEDALGRYLAELPAA
jgi:dTDP-4-dehydrorhamnose reductase